jgi:hypothetical protein
MNQSKLLKEKLAIKNHIRQFKEETDYIDEFSKQIEGEVRVKLLKDVKKKGGEVS